MAELELKLDSFFKSHAEHVCCKKGCSACCEVGDYPISELELNYIMEGFVKLDNQTKLEVQQNLKQIEKGDRCPFLINSECSIYPYRPIICRVHGLAYLCKDNVSKLPYCVNMGLNYSKVYKDGSLEYQPVLENLDTSNLLKNFEYGKIRNLYDWINKSV